MKQPLGKAGPGEVPKGERSMQTLPFTVGASGRAQAELGAQMWLGSEAISFICWGEGNGGSVGKRQPLTLLGVGSIYLEGRARGKVLSSRKEFSSPVECSHCFGFTFFFFFPAWTVATQNTDLYKNRNGMI